MSDEDERDEERSGRPTTVGELKLGDLPPIEDLKITVPVDSLVKIGKVVSIVDVLVVIESIRSMPPLDLDTVLFKPDGSALGQVFDTFGTVTEPHYTVRFASLQQICDKGIGLNMEIFFSPQIDRGITKFAFVDQLKKIKGTDASGEHDNEQPPDAVDSDDERF
jgi:H/ACA ribonucleoprotein complex non-core subunit NAF1